MRIVCPACEAVYEVPDSLLGKPRPLRCARCGHEWVPQPASGASTAAGLAEHAAERGTAREMGRAETDSAETDSAETGSAELERLEVGRPEVGRADIVPERRVPMSRVPVAPPAPSDPMLMMFPPLVGRPERSANRVAALGWGVTALLLALVLAAAYVWRADVQAAWPPIQRAYAAIGLH